MPVTRAPGRDAVDLSAFDRAMASLTARGPAPRSASRPAASSVLSAPSGLAAARAPASLSARAPAIARSSESTPAPSPVQAPAPGAPQSIAPPDNVPLRKPLDFAARADGLLASQLPSVAQRAERAVSRVLVVAAQPDKASLDDEIRAAARTIQVLPQDPLLAIGNVDDEAWLLNEAAHSAYWRRGNLQEAIALQTRAFGANPLNAEVVGNLAVLRLKQRPAQADAARQLALHALTLSDAGHPGGRIEDWSTLAVASALSGRNGDARSAWFVTLALASSLERQCKVAVNAYATHGERLSFPVQAMLLRVRSSSRPGQSPYCEWPPHWEAIRPLR
jgi:tetratricopeptide (TPR) repeat protein